MWGLYCTKKYKKQTVTKEAEIRSLDLIVDASERELLVPSDAYHHILRFAVLTPVRDKRNRTPAVQTLKIHVKCEVGGISDRKIAKAQRECCHHGGLQVEFRVNFGRIREFCGFLVNSAPTRDSQYSPASRQNEVRSRGTAPVCSPKTRVFSKFTPKNQPSPICIQNLKIDQNR